MSFIDYLNETVSKQFLALSKEIDKCTKETHSKLVKELDAAFKNKIITAKEYSELDDKLFDKFKTLNNKLSEEDETKSVNIINDIGDELSTEEPILQTEE